jgi:hypothetical protein
MEEMLILRLPEGIDADSVRGIRSDYGNLRAGPRREPLLRVFTKDEEFPARLMPLASAVEVHERKGDDSVMKRADVGQVIHVFRKEEHCGDDDVCDGKQSDDVKDNGLSKILLDMMTRGGVSMEEDWVIVDSQPWMRDGEVLTFGLSRLILDHPDSFFSLPENESDDEDNDWMVDDSDDEEDTTFSE